jgi:hypothetical protein
VIDPPIGVRLDPLGGLDLALLHAVERDLQALAILGYDLDMDGFAVRGLHKHAHREHDFLQHWFPSKPFMAGSRAQESTKRAKLSVKVKRVDDAELCGAAQTNAPSRGASRAENV